MSRYDSFLSKPGLMLGSEEKSEQNWEKFLEKILQSFTKVFTSFIIEKKKTGK